MMKPEQQEYRTERPGLFNPQTMQYITEQSEKVYYDAFSANAPLGTDPLFQNADIMP